MNAVLTGIALTLLFVCVGQALRILWLKRWLHNLRQIRDAQRDEIVHANANLKISNLQRDMMRDRLHQLKVGGDGGLN